MELRSLTPVLGGPKRHSVTGYAYRSVLVGGAAGALLGGVATSLAATSDWVFIWVVLAPWYLTDVMGRGTQDWSLYLIAAAYFGVFGGVIGRLMACRLSRAKLAGALLILLSGHAAIWIAGGQRFSRGLHNMRPLPAEAIPDNMIKAASPTPGH